MALDKKELAKLLSIVASKSNQSAKTKQMSPTREVDPNEYDAPYKASAILQALNPILTQELRKKNPEGVDNLMSSISGLTNQTKEQYKKFQSGEISASDWKNYYKNQASNRTKLIEDFDFSQSLEADEIQKILGPERYKDYVSAIGVSRSSMSNEGYNIGRVTGNIETAQNINDAKFGKRMATQMSKSGITKSGDNGYSIQYVYDPKTGKISISPDSYGVDMQTGQPIASKQKEQVKFVK